MESDENQAQAIFEIIMKKIEEEVENKLTTVDSMNNGIKIINSFFQKERMNILDKVYKNDRDINNLADEIIKNAQAKYVQNYEIRMTKEYEEFMNGLNYTNFIQKLAHDQGACLITDKNDILIKRFVKNDPPFYKLKFKGRDIYILGSSHNMPPQTLLCTAAYQEIEMILRKENSILFIEKRDITEQDEMLEILKAASVKEEVQWKVSPTLDYLFNGEMLYYDFNNHEIKNTGYPLVDIKKITSQRNRILCLSNYVSIKRMNVFGLGFEGTLERRKDSHHTYFLDFPPGDMHERLLLNPTYHRKYDQFQEGKSSSGTNAGGSVVVDLMELCQFENNSKMDSSHAKAKIISYVTKIPEYTYNHKFKKKAGDDIIVNLRNDLWAFRVKDYLDHNNDDAPIFIVCGTAHLFKFSPEEGSFLTLLVNLIGDGAQLQRYSHHEQEWQWIPYNPEID